MSGGGRTGGGGWCGHQLVGCVTSLSSIYCSEAFGLVSHAKFVGKQIQIGLAQSLSRGLGAVCGTVNQRQW